MCVCVLFFVQAEDGIRDLVRSRGLGDVYKRQDPGGVGVEGNADEDGDENGEGVVGSGVGGEEVLRCPAVDGLSLIHI